MKKRLISMLLTVLMVASLVGGMSVSAYADSTYQTISYTVKSGDTLLQICNNNGLNWYTCEAAINKLNNLSSSNYRYLSVGSVIKLPASNEDAAKVMAATTTTTTTVTTTTNGVSNTVTTTNTSSGSSASSSASYWLISYTMQKGETVSGVCNTLGINFDTYSSLIKSVNGISSWNKVSAGKTIYLPTTTAPVSGTSCYAVMSHTIAKGETATSICKAYGTSYSAVQKLISGLNPNSNMNSLKAGATLLVPVPTVITSTTTASTTTSSSSTVVAGTNTTTTGTTNTNTNTNTGSTGSTTKTYKLSTGTVTDGTIGFTVNGKSVTTAAAGSKVHITVTPGSYKALSSLTLTRADGSKATTISDGEFTMPESDVTVSATFSSGRYIGTSSNGGTVQLTLNGVEVSHAVKGAKVQVNVTPKDGYEISGISVVNTSTGATVAGDVKNGGTFTMPDATVLVRVTYKTSAAYTLTTVSDETADLNGSFTLKSGNTEISSAIAGTKVLIDAEPADGYKVGTITVVTDGGKTVTVTDNYFTMPTDNVTVSIVFDEITDDEEFDITVSSSVYGWATALADGKSSTTKGKDVAVELNAVKGFYPTKFTVKANGSTRTYELAEGQTTGSFEMPSGDVVVTPYFEAYNAAVTEVDTNDSTIGDIVVSTNGKQLASWAAGGEMTIAADKGNEVAVQANLTVSVSMKKAGYTVKSILLKSDALDKDIELTNGTAITVPADLANEDFTIYVEYSANSVKLGDSKTDSNVSYVCVNRGSQDGDSVKSGDSISTGEKLHIYAEGKPGYDVKIYAVYKDANGKEQKEEITSKNGYDITVPACSSFYVKVESSAAERKIVVNNDWPDVIKIQIGSAKEQVVPVGSTEFKVKTGDKVIIKSFGTGGTFSLSNDYEGTGDNALKITNSNDKQYSFTMPGVDDTLTVTLY